MESGFIIRFPFRIVYLADDGIHRYHQLGAGEIPGTYILAYGSAADDDNIHIRVEAVNHHFGSGGSGGGGDVASAIEDTWDAAKGQIKQVVNNVVFPVIDVVLAVLFFAKVATAYMDYRKHGQFEFTAPAILFACLVFSMTAPLYIWSIVGI